MTRNELAGLGGRRVSSSSLEGEEGRVDEWLFLEDPSLRTLRKEEERCPKGGAFSRSGRGMAAGRGE